MRQINDPPPVSIQRLKLDVRISWHVSPQNSSHWFLNLRILKIQLHQIYGSGHLLTNDLDWIGDLPGVTLESLRFYFPNRQNLEALDQQLSLIPI